MKPWVLASAGRVPEAPALITTDGIMSHAELAGAALRVAGFLREGGLVPGDRVATLMEATPLSVALLHAAQISGVVVVPLNTRLTAAELSTILQRSAPAWLVHDERHAPLARKAVDLITRGVPPRATSNRRCADPVENHQHSHDELFRIIKKLPRLLHVADWPMFGSTSRSTASPSGYRIEQRRPLTVVFTSGTTGPAKGVILSNGNHDAAARAAIGRVDFAGEDRWLCVVPLYHVAGLSILVRAAIAGAAVVLETSFEATRACRVIARHAVTHVSVVTSMLAWMLDNGLPAAGGESLRCVLVGGGRIPATLVARALEASVPIFPTYGLTETASQVVTAHPAEARAHPESVGRALPGVDIRIGTPNAHGLGEILVRGPQVTSGYLDDPEMSRVALRDGWLHTGDLGCIDVGGRLTVSTRRSDLIVTGGENVVPEEVEAVLCESPSVVEAAVYAIEDDEWGQRIAAAVVLCPGRDLDAVGLREWCRERLAGYKIPRHFEAVAKLPRTPSGKLQRRLLPQQVRKAWPDDEC